MSLGRASGRRWVIGAPYLWLLVFFLIPFLVTVKIAFSPLISGIPPYGPLLSVTADGALQLTLHVENFAYLLQDPLYVLSYLASLRTALVTTIGCLLIGYPMAYAIARAAPRIRPMLLMLVVMPFWTSFLIRVYAWMGVLKDNGLLNQILLWPGRDPQPLQILGTPNRGRHRHGLRLSAVHGAAALRHAGEARPGAARGGRGSRRQPVRGLLA